MERKNVLIVGGMSDMASSLIEKLTSEHFHIISISRGDNNNPNVSNVQGDALDEKSYEKALELLQGKSLDGVIHLVGSLTLRPPHALSKEAFEEVIATNLVTAFLSLSKCGKYMLRNGGGRMVFVSSVAASLGLINHEAISAAKGGVESMVRSAAATYAQRNIRVNCIAPGLTDTKMTEQMVKSQSQRDAAVEMIPIKRINMAEEMARTMAWLINDAPDNLTGQVIHLDGGMANLRN